MTDFHRIKRLPPYVFEQVNKMKAAERAKGVDIIDLGMGNPGSAAPEHVIEKLVEAIGKPRTDRYSASKGIPGLRRAQAAYYQRRFGVTLDPDTQVVATLGSKEGFANMAQAITGAGRRRARAQSELSDPRLRLPDGGRRDPLRAGDEPTPAFFPALERRCAFHPEADRARHLLSVEPDALGRLARLLSDLVAFAKKHELIVLSDLAYAEVYFDEQSAALDPAGAGRDRCRGRVHLDVEDLLHGRLAHGLCGRQ
jgi:alanine-synthesizing transaminase